MTTMTIFKGGFMNILDCRTNIDLMNYDEMKNREIKMLKYDIERLENTTRLLNDENLKFINEIDKLEIELKDLKQMLQPYKNKIQELINENERLRSKSFEPKTRQITDKQIKEIKDLRNSGFSYREIQDKTGWSKFTIGRVLNGEYD